jgi:copper(I)-binding protein
MLLISVCASAADPAPRAPLRVEDAWVRWLPAGVPAGGYATLINDGDEARVLIGAVSSAFGDVSIHRSVDRGGTMAMEAVESINIQAHSKLNFAAAGYHLMLMQPANPIHPGDKVPITLRFADGRLLTIPFEVRR